ncbi:TetR/AcrR family transcriptional regulator [Paenibacillus silviterrae]|uniref:TetR/AcrR family transcriptional regulator n=1 Tax=Paenibacillus silviterrae TaxID=3242194 RepID=UPI0032B285C5
MELVQDRKEEIKQVMKEAIKLSSPIEQLQYIADNALRNVKEQPRAYRFYLHLQTHPEEDQVVSACSQMLKDEMIRQSRVQVEIFKKLNAANPELESLHFSTALHGIMLMYSMYPDNISLEQLKYQMINAFIKGYAD